MNIYDEELVHQVTHEIFKDFKTFQLLHHAYGEMPIEEFVLSVIRTARRNRMTIQQTMEAYLKVTKEICNIS